MTFTLFKRKTILFKLGIIHNDLFKRSDTKINTVDE